MTGEPGRALEGASGGTERNGETTAIPEMETLLETKLDLLAKRARQEPKLRFTTLAHLLEEGFLAESYGMLKKRKAPGVDGISVEEYGKGLEEKLTGLVARMKAKRYRPQPVRRAYIPKEGGQRRPLGIPAAEDKVVQMGLARILEAIYEGDFLKVSYGFRPGRGCHEALRAFDRMVMTKPVSHVIEVDVEGYYNAIDHEWLMRCLEQRIADPSFLRLIRRTLKAGVLEEGRWRQTEEGAPQGGIVSPILSNIYLHYVLDLWFEKVLKKELKGYAELLRYCDDFVIGCQDGGEAERILAELKERLKKFGLEVSEAKTRIVEFGRFTLERAQKRGEKAGTVEFLGFTHYCTQSRKGRFIVGRRTSGKKFRAKLAAMSRWLQNDRNLIPLADWWQVLKWKLNGHYQYYGITGNRRSVDRFYQQVLKLTYKWWNRRSQKRSGNWEDFQRRLHWNPLPKPRIVHVFRLADAT
jgi:RNA-directed DNA polymerase